MGTSERKQREFEQREQLFLTAAEEMIRTEGVTNLQMAKLAEACDYATGTLYQHFTSKEDLLVAVADIGCAFHVEMFQRARRWDASTRDRMFAIAVCDADYTASNPMHTSLMQYVFTQVVWENASPERRESVLANCQPVVEVVSAIVQEALDKGDLPAHAMSKMELALGPWCLCAGLHQLVHTQGLLEVCGIGHPRQLLFRQIQIYLNGMGWEPLMDPDDIEAISALVERIRTEVIGQ